MRNIAKFFLHPLAIWIIVFQLISLTIGIITKAGMYPWYIELNKSFLTPPGYVFGIIWPLLYCCLAIFGWLLKKKRHRSIFNKLFQCYWIQMLFNWLWSPVFFNFHFTRFALTILIVIVAINAYIITKLIDLKKIQLIYMLLPYFLWICFALYLNTMIVIMN